MKGDLKFSLHPKAKDIIYPILGNNKELLAEEYEMLSLLNEAHLLALAKNGLVSSEIVVLLLREIAILRKNKFKKLLELRLTRGTYLLYENYLIKKISMNVSGSMHMGRSRNDINVTLFKLKIRKFYSQIFNNLCRLRTTLLNKAKQYLDLAMPIYSQFQVAQVGTYSYYLLAVEEALSRDQKFLKDLFPLINESPLGVASGCGTSINIDRYYIAELLGFSTISQNALDTVANRDLALRILGVLSVLGTLLSRVAQDYQLWSTSEFGFFRFPDDLCGGSSMMPQKKKPLFIRGY